ncbi:MAG: periplasmic heavy metal sensor [candidate division KSB1 bacterium]|nr:periplasmic heavy metal sensor [candidate division KSB1 bacterium]MDZ7313709.1 periplasmic heavy metal sensor [candidate division KSB1 bacterium]
MKEKIFVIAAFVLTFAVGVLTGALVVREFSHPPLPPSRMGYEMGRHRPITSKELGAKLNLSKEQRQQVQQIIAKHQQQLRKHLSQMRPTSRQIFKQMVAEIDSVLTPEQREKFHRDFPMPGKMPPWPGPKPDSMRPPEF